MGGLDPKHPTVAQNNKNDEQNTMSAPVPKFLVITSPQNILGTMSPFFIQKALQGICGNPKSVKKLKSGDYLIETISETQSKSLLLARQFGTITITASPHNSLNSSKGVISETDLLGVSDEEILTELSSQGVTAVRRITLKKADSIVSTKHIVLTFNSPNLPSHIKAGYLNCPIRPFIPNPLRCFNCQGFGHSTNTCRGVETCSRCSNIGHTFISCSLPIKCKNCSGDHTANSRDCPRWIEEKEIQTVKVEEKLSYQEAKQKVISRTPKPHTPYAAVVKKTCSIGVQTCAPILNIAPSVSTQAQTSTNQTSTPPKPKTITKKKLQINTLKTHLQQQIRYKPAPLSKKGRAAEIALKKQKIMEEKEKALNSSSEGSSAETSESGEMEVERGLETPPHLQPRKQGCKDPPSNNQT